MIGRPGKAIGRGFLLPLVAYALASLVHHVHNAVFLRAYPNMPVWLTPGLVGAAWLGTSAVGLIGYLLLRRHYSIVGLAVVAMYAALGLDGLGHYRLAPMSAHTFTMNLTILLEVSTAVLLLIAVTASTARLLRGTPEKSG